MITIYEKIFLGVLFFITIFLLTRKRDVKFDQEYYDMLNSEKYKVKGQY